MFKVDFPVTIVKHYSLKSKDDRDGKWVIEGYAATEDYDLHGDVISEEAIKNSENDLLENSTVLYNHDDEQPIGKVLESKFTRQGLKIKVLISKTVPEIWRKIQEGVLNKFSITARILKAEKEFVDIIGKIANVIKKMYLIEVSLVAVPANPKARALCWYISKGLNDYLKQGGEIPMGKATPTQIQAAFKGQPEGAVDDGFQTDSNGNIIDEKGNVKGKVKDLPTVPEGETKDLTEALKADAEATPQTPAETEEEQEIEEETTQASKTEEKAEDEARDKELEAEIAEKVDEQVKKLVGDPKVTEKLKKALKTESKEYADELEPTAMKSDLQAEISGILKAKKERVNEMANLIGSREFTDEVKEALLGLITREQKANSMILSLLGEQEEELGYDHDKEDKEEKTVKAKPKKANTKKRVKKKKVSKKPIKKNLTRKNILQSDEVQAIIQKEVEKKVDQKLSMPMKRKGLVSTNEPESLQTKVIKTAQKIDDPVDRLKHLLSAQQD